MYLSGEAQQLWSNVFSLLLVGSVPGHPEIKGTALDYVLSLMNERGDDPAVKQLLSYLQSEQPNFYNNVMNKYLTEGVASGDIGANDAYAEFGANGAAANEETGKYLDNLISQGNAAEDRAFQTEMRDTSITSSGNQLQQLGLSPSNVISVGGASSGVTSSAAGTSNMQTSANRRQQLAMNQYNQRMGMAKSLISMAGSMASSGIYGAALGAARHSASALASAASHSGLMALKTISGRSYSDVLMGLQNK